MRTLVRRSALALALAACARGGAEDPKELDAAVAAAEALALSFADSVRGEAGQARVAAESRAAREKVDTLSACADPVPREPTSRHATSYMTVHLPADFRLLNAEQAERMAQPQGYTRYEWKGADNSTVAIYPGSSSSVHSGWTGLLKSECDIQVAGHRAHVDLADNSIGFTNLVVHAIYYDPPRSPMVFLAKARSRARQEELLHALHTVNIGPLWGNR